MKLNGPERAMKIKPLILFMPVDFIAIFPFAGTSNEF